MNGRIIAAVVVLAIVGFLVVGVYTTYQDTHREQITIEMQLRTEPHAGYWMGEPVIGCRVNVTYTSNVEGKVYMPEYPEIVVHTTDGRELRFNQAKESPATSGKTIPTYLTYKTGQLIDMADYHFELTDSMKAAGNYTLVVT